VVLAARDGAGTLRASLANEPKEVQELQILYLPVTEASNQNSALVLQD